MLRIGARFVRSQILARSAFAEQACVRHYGDEVKFASSPKVPNTPEEKRDVPFWSRENLTYRDPNEKALEELDDLHDFYTENFENDYRKDLANRKSKTPFIAHSAGEILDYLPPPSKNMSKNEADYRACLQEEQDRAELMFAKLGWTEENKDSFFEKNFVDAERRRQAYAEEERLGIEHMDDPQFRMLYEDNSDTTDLLHELNLTRYLLDIKNVGHQTRLGKVKSFVALVAVGNEDGVFGFGTASVKEMGLATEVATKRAIRRLQPIPRYGGHTLHHPVRAKVGGTSVEIRPKPEDTGLVCHNHLAMMCELAGIKNCSITLTGQPNAMNMAKAFLKAVLSQRTIDEVSLVRGVSLQHLKQRVRVI